MAHNNLGGGWCSAEGIHSKGLFPLILTKILGTKKVQDLWGSEPETFQLSAAGQLVRSIFSRACPFRELLPTYHSPFRALEGETVAFSHLLTYVAAG